MTRYLLGIQQPTGGQPPPEVLEEIMRKLDALGRDLRDAGALVFNGGLQPPETATVLRPDGADVLITDGPYLEGKEHLGGFWVVEAEDLDAALRWGRRAALATTLPIEVRPFHPQG